VRSWISDATYNASVCGYGLRPEHRPFIDLPLGDFPTYTDAILLFSRLLKKPVRYLEIGVSVGKNFFQVAEYLTRSTLVGFDIEKINPVLEGMFSGRQAVDGMVTGYSHSSNGNSIRYLCGDLRDGRAWEKLSGTPFTIIFSDAVHDPEWVLHEFRMIERLGLRDRGEFIMVWDDLAGPMVGAFDEIWYSLEQEGAQRFLIPLNGWLGVNEPPHMVGFITRLDT
jgi:hypothetical protein